MNFFQWQFETTFLNRVLCLFTVLFYGQAQKWGKTVKSHAKPTLN